MAPTASEPPLILVTNDDGIACEGLEALVRQLEPLGEVFVVAPHEEQSAVGHGINLSRPLRITTVAPRRFAVTGTPADAVLLGLFHLCPRRPALVVSGINLGLNLGTDVFYSGTVAGALEGTIHGVPGLAVSQETADGPGSLADLLDRTGRFAALVASRMLEQPPPAGIVLSINAPARATDRFAWTRLGRRVYREQVERRMDLRGDPYYWVGGPVIRQRSDPGTDSHAVETGAMSLTPLGLDLTATLPSCYYGWTLEGYEPRSHAPD